MRLVGFEMTGSKEVDAELINLIELANKFSQKVVEHNWCCNSCRGRSIAEMKAVMDGVGAALEMKIASKDILAGAIKVIEELSKEIDGPCRRSGTDKDRPSLFDMLGQKSMPEILYSVEGLDRALIDSYLSKFDAIAVRGRDAEWCCTEHSAAFKRLVGALLIAAKTYSEMGLLNNLLLTTMIETADRLAAEMSFYTNIDPSKHRTDSIQDIIDRVLFNHSKASPVYKAMGGTYEN